MRERDRGLDRLYQGGDHRTDEEIREEKEKEQKQSEENARRAQDRKTEEQEAKRIMEQRIADGARTRQAREQEIVQGAQATLKKLEADRVATVKEAIGLYKTKTLSYEWMAGEKPSICYRICRFAEDLSTRDITSKEDTEIFNILLRIATFMSQKNQQEIQLDDHSSIEAKTWFDHQVDRYLKGEVPSDAAESLLILLSKIPGEQAENNIVKILQPKLSAIALDKLNDKEKFKKYIVDARCVADMIFAIDELTKQNPPKKDWVFGPKKDPMPIELMALRAKMVELNRPTLRSAPSLSEKETVAVAVAQATYSGQTAGAPQLTSEELDVLVSVQKFGPPPAYKRSASMDRNLRAEELSKPSAPPRPTQAEQKEMTAKELERLALGQEFSKQPEAEAVQPYIPVVNPAAAVPSAPPLSNPDMKEATKTLVQTGSPVHSRVVTPELPELPWDLRLPSVPKKQEKQPEKPSAVAKKTALK